MESLKREFLGLHKRQRENTRFLDPRYQIQRHHLFVRYLGPDSSHFANGVAFTRLDTMNQASIEDFVQSQVIFYRNMRRSFGWKVMDYELPLNLAESLLKEGLTLSGTETLMFMECKEQRPIQEIPGISIRELTSPESFEEIRTVHEQVWGLDPTSLIETLKKEKAADPNSFRMLLACAGEKPVSCAWLRLDSYFGTMLGGTTLPEWRRKGIYGQMVDLRINMVLEKGLRFLSSDAGTMSAPILEKLGFFPAANVSRYRYSLPLGM